jgi:hypothetical protein
MINGWNHYILTRRCCHGRAVDHRGGGNHLRRCRAGHMVGSAAQSSVRC